MLCRTAQAIMIFFCSFQLCTNRLAEASKASFQNSKGAFNYISGPCVSCVVAPLLVSCRSLDRCSKAATTRVPNVSEQVSRMISLLEDMARMRIFKNSAVMLTARPASNNVHEL